MPAKPGGLLGEVGEVGESSSPDPVGRNVTVELDPSTSTLQTTGTRQIRRRHDTQQPTAPRRVTVHVRNRAHRQPSPPGRRWVTLGQGLECGNGSGASVRHAEPDVRLGSSPRTSRSSPGTQMTQVHLCRGVHRCCRSTPAWPLSNLVCLHSGLCAQAEEERLQQLRAAAAQLRQRLTALEVQRTEAAERLAAGMQQHGELTAAVAVKTADRQKVSEQRTIAMYVHGSRASMCLVRFLFGVPVCALEGQGVCDLIGGRLSSLIMEQGLRVRVRHPVSCVQSLPPPLQCTMEREVDRGREAHHTATRTSARTHSPCRCGWCSVCWSPRVSWPESRTAHSELQPLPPRNAHSESDQLDQIIQPPVCDLCALTTLRATRGLRRLPAVPSVSTVSASLPRLRRRWRRHAGTGGLTGGRRISRRLWRH